jgi:hypothetical protein
LPTSDPSPKQAPGGEYRRALALLAGSPDGCPEAIMLAHGFPFDLLVDAIRGGLATAHEERVFAGKREIKVTRLKITERGRLALATLKRM